MAAAGPKEQGGSAPLDTLHTNRLLLILIGGLALLSFMDVQARRHSQIHALPPASERLDTVRQNLEQPLRRSASAILQGVDEIEGGAHNAPPALSAEELNSPEAPQEADPSSFDSMRLRPLDAVQSSRSEIELYFLRFQNAHSELVRVRRPAAPGSVSLLRVLQELQRGPTNRERGLLNMFDSQIEIRGLRLEGGVAIIDLSDRVGRMGNHVIADRLDQLCYTLTQFSSVRGVRLLVNGEAVRQLGASALEVPETLHRGERSITDYR
ncbi:MAG: GerMN domain-containing protein [Leptospirales bacterium]|nr:GerMN domain-containing protein [Leptospirales bacterium]